ncbi:hypothetical protein BC827DRAFT_1236906 [Russula dissimulans]|nr:hypothetical protein BC827DRAFT_1236906 [Russula dissimulans]
MTPRHILAPWGFAHIRLLHACISTFTLLGTLCVRATSVGVRRVPVHNLGTGPSLSQAPAPPTRLLLIRHPDPNGDLVPFAPCHAAPPLDRPPLHYCTHAAAKTSPAAPPPHTKVLHLFSWITLERSNPMFRHSLQRVTVFGVSDGSGGHYPGNECTQQIDSLRADGDA